MTEPAKPIGTHKALKPMLSGTERLIRGYAVLHQQEAKYTEIALREMPEPVEAWYRSLTLFDTFLRREHDSGLTGGEPSPEWYSWDLRLRLAGTAIGIAKLTLDAALAGYYSATFALIRHMLETWLQLVYVRILPTEAVRWYTSAEGASPREPGSDTIKRALDRHAKKSADQELKHNLAVVGRKIKDCNKGAHPSSLVIGQSQTGKPGFSQLGANYLEHQFVTAMSLGTVAIALLLHEMSRSAPIDRSWYEEFRSVHEARNAWHNNYSQNHPTSDQVGGN